MELGRLTELHPNFSERRLCTLLGTNRSTTWRHKSGKTAAVVDLAKVRRDKELTQRICALVKRFPTWGYRRIWAWLRHRDKVLVNKKMVHRIVKENAWQVRKQVKTPRPRITSSVSATSAANERWAMDATSLWTKDGWVGVMAVIDCCTRKLVGVHVSRRGRAVEAEKALEMACLAEFGLIYAKGGRPVLRSDNGKVFTSKRFMGRCKQYGLSQEFITPYTPQQNGMFERFFRSLKEECIWQHNFEGLHDAKEAIYEWVAFYNKERPLQALGYLSPLEFEAQQRQHVA